MDKPITTVAEAQQAFASAFNTQGQQGNTGACCSFTEEVISNDGLSDQDGAFMKQMMGEMKPIKRSVVKQGLQNVDSGKLQAIMERAAQASKASTVSSEEVKCFS